MVLRRLPVSFLLMLLALAAPTAARAQSPAPGTTAPGAYDDGGGTYDDGGAYADDGGQWYDDGATGGQAPAGIPVPATTVPATPIPAPAPIPAAPVLPTVPVTRTIAGSVARLRTDGKAAIPRGAPQRVQA